MTKRVSLFRRARGTFAGIRTLAMQDALGWMGMFDPIGKLKRYYRHWGNGRQVSIFASSNNPKELEIIFQKKIAAEDVADGKLVSVAIQTVGTKRGKRVTSIIISLEAARGLHEILGEALRDAERCKKYQRNTTLLGMYVSSVIRDVDFLNKHAPSQN